MGSAAAWRTQPLSHMDMLARIRHQGDRINPLLQLPWIETKCFRPDWLHVADLGVTADFIGNALKILEPLCPGPSRAARVSFLNIWMQDWYDRNHIEDRLNVLLPELFIQRNKGYKLRAGAAKARVLVPWIDHVCQVLLPPDDPIYGAVRAAASCLGKVYGCLREDSFDAEVARDQSTRFALLWLALHDAQNGDDDAAWRLKPKLHMFLHMCSDGSRPARFWCYRDEEFGGGVARRARRRGGVLSAPSVSKTVLHRFWIQHPAFYMR